MDKRKFIFIIGMPHAGTTWVNKWLSQHPDLVGHQEINLLSSMLESHHKLIDRGWFDSMNYKTIQWYCEKLLGFAADRENKKHILVHNCMLINWGKEPARVFPDGYYIVLHRDGRRIAASLKNRRPDIDGEWLTQRWLRQAEIITTGNLPSRTLVLKYTDLCQDVNKSKEITDFLGLEHHCDISLDDKVNCSFGEVMPEDYWKTFLSEKDKEHFGKLDNMLNKLGYF
ncbi:hypothetical protein LCGC14_1053610 [marine sediment metagenome]|uniref:Sulfotransferase domain-containing protein n=1 Tax=marine sediment metagenome TaxID=412755 RepID=A0A0F9Q667_9ZZZZ